MKLRLLNLFRKVAFWEGVSYLLLLGICMPLKYGLGIPEPVSVVGMIHGILFIAYCLVLARAYLVLKWPKMKTFLAFLASLIPFGTFVLERSLRVEAETYSA